jgi:hypothetical protein
MALLLKLSTHEAWMSVHVRLLGELSSVAGWASTALGWASTAPRWGSSAPGWASSASGWASSDLRWVSSLQGVSQVSTDGSILSLDYSRVCSVALRWVSIAVRGSPMLLNEPQELYGEPQLQSEPRDTHGSKVTFRASLWAFQSVFKAVQSSRAPPNSTKGET